MKNLLKISSLLALPLCFAACGNQEQETAKEDARVEKVRTQIVQKEAVERTISLTCNLEGYEMMDIAPSLTGIIEHIYVEEGDRVNKGDDLLRMDQTTYRTTQQAYDNLKVEMARMDALKEAGSISQQTYDQTKLSYDQTAENLKFYKDNTYVKAQFHGVISAKNYEDGELYSGTSPVLSLVQIDKLKLYVNVPEQYFARVKKGMELDIYSEIYPDKKFGGKVEIVFPTIDQASHTFKVKVAIPNAGELLRPGMYVRTDLKLGKEEIKTVPYQSVLKLIGSNDRYVYINVADTAKRVSVKMGERYGANVEILDDELKVGDEIITTGQARVVEGVKLEVITDNNAE